MINRLSKSVIISMFIVVTIFASMATVVNAESCNLKITLKQHDNLGSVSGVQFLVYKVGNVETTTDKPVFDSRYGIANAPKTAADILTDIGIIKKADKPEPVAKGTTSSDGVLDLTLDRGIYYIEAAKNDYGNIEPTLIWLPYFDETNGNMVYSVGIEPKAEPAGTVEGQEDFPPKTTDDTVKDGQVKGEVASEAKTSDSFEYMIYIGILILSIVMVATILISRKKENDNVR